MLIFSRRETEQICLGDDIVLTVVKVAGDKVRVGVKAPPHVMILRNELEIDVERRHSLTERTADECDITISIPIPTPAKPTERADQPPTTQSTEGLAKPTLSTVSKQPGPLARFRRAA
jgi:carbon storage regulator